MYNKKQNEKPLFAEVKPCDDEVRQQTTNKDYKQQQREQRIPYIKLTMWVLNEAFENEECLLELEMRNEKFGIERELKEINRELKEIGPQADEDGEQQLPAIGQQLKEIGPQADGGCDE